MCTWNRKPEYIFVQLLTISMVGWIKKPVQIIVKRVYILLTEKYTISSWGIQLNPGNKIPKLNDPWNKKKGKKLFFRCLKFCFCWMNTTLPSTNQATDDIKYNTIPTRTFRKFIRPSKISSQRLKWCYGFFCVWGYKECLSDNNALLLLNVVLKKYVLPLATFIHLVANTNQ